MTVERASRSSLQLEGQLEKRSLSLIRRWQARWFRLYADAIWYSDIKAWRPRPNQVLDLKDILAVHVENYPGVVRNGFVIETRYRTYVLRAGSSADAQRWC